MKPHFLGVIFGGILSALALVADAQAAAKVGVAAAVKNNVQRVTGAGAQQLNVGADLFTSERIRTGDDSIAQILLLDKTTLTVGPRAEVTLDSFVYNPSQGGAGRVVLNAVQGTFRFISGSQAPRSYEIKTPVGSLGIRGTIVDLIIQNGQVTVILVEGSLTITVFGRTYTLNKPGTAFTFSANGNAQGPFAWDGTIVNTSAQVSFPLYGWHFQGEPLNNGLPNINIGGIDQLNGIIQRGLTPPPAPPSGSSICTGPC
jgi:ferric-dicitrate binding protein FerR (iron transport regulator)